MAMFALGTSVVLAVVGIVVAGSRVSLSAGPGVHYSQDMVPNCTVLYVEQTASLTLDCGRNHTSDVEERLTNLVRRYPDLVSLQVQSTNISHLDAVDLSGLANLTTLSMLHNPGIQTLPEGFLTKNKRLKTVQISDSRVSELSDGVFEGLLDLEVVNLWSNKIRSVGPTTFLDLPQLKEVNLNENLLTILDIWPLYIAVNLTHSIDVSFEDNQVDRFTNSLNWSYTCDPHLRKPVGNIYMKNNRVRHLMDIVDGWRFPTDISILCLFLYNKFHIHLKYNPFDCDCIDYRIYPFLHGNEHMDQLKCYTSPVPSLVGELITALDVTRVLCDIHGGCPDGCQCWQRPANRTLHVDCRDRGLVEMPVSVPIHKNLSGYSYQMDVQANNIQSLPSRTYFPLLQTLDLSRNHLNTVDPEALLQLFNHTEKILLNDNTLSSLPIEVCDSSLQAVSRLALFSNPWSCCQNQWFLPWLQSIQNKTMGTGSTVCGSPSWLQDRIVFSLSPDEACVDPAMEQIKKILVYCAVAILVTLLFFVLPTSVIYAKRVWIYKHFTWHPFDWDECDNEKKQFDAFVSYADEDESWVLDLVTQLEAVGFKLNIHKRDFMGGQTILDNVGDAVDRSKRTVCVLSRAFLESQVCRWEFDTALTIALQTKSTRLIAILREEIPAADLKKCRTVQLYLSRHTYIDANSPFFRDNLLYSLPITPYLRHLSQQRGSTGGAATSSEHAPLLV